MEEYDESVNKALCEEICKYYNDAVDIAAIYNDTQEKIADVVFQARRYEDYDGWVYYVEEPILVFPDGSKFALEDYFTAESFSGLMERISEFFE